MGIQYHLSGTSEDLAKYINHYKQKTNGANSDSYQRY